MMRVCIGEGGLRFSITITRKTLILDNTNLLSRQDWSKDHRHCTCGWVGSVLDG